MLVRTRFEPSVAWEVGKTESAEKKPSVIKVITLLMTTKTLKKKIEKKNINAFTAAVIAIAKATEVATMLPTHRLNTSCDPHMFA